MKRITLRFRSTNKDIFDAIARGEKTVETRAATPRYRRVQAGDALVCVCGAKRFTKKVKRVTVFRSVAALVKRYPVRRIMPSFKTTKELVDAYRSYPQYPEKIKKWGLVAWELC